MSSPKTKLIGNPWASLAPVAEKPVRQKIAPVDRGHEAEEKKPKKPQYDPTRPPPGRVGSGRVDVSDLSIDLDAVYDPNWKPPRPPGKYDALFEALPIGKAITCKPQDCNTIAHAMRNWGRHNGRTLDVTIDKNYRGTGQGKVFLLGDKAGAQTAK